MIDVLIVELVELIRHFGYGGVKWYGWEGITRWQTLVRLTMAMIHCAMCSF